MPEISLDRELPPTDRMRGKNPRQLEERQFTTMMLAFRDHGGIMTSESVVELLRRTASQPISKLARWIVSRTIITLVRNGEVLVPMFQFNTGDFSVRADFTRTLDELRDIFDDWELALWFAMPNDWLQDRLPIACLDERGVDVVQAARADRFIARA